MSPAPRLHQSVSSEGKSRPWELDRGEGQVEGKARQLAEEQRSENQNHKTGKEEDEGGKHTIQSSVMLALALVHTHMGTHLCPAWKGDLGIHKIYFSEAQELIFPLAKHCKAGGKVSRIRSAALGSEEDEEDDVICFLSGFFAQVYSRKSSMKRRQKIRVLSSPEKGHQLEYSAIDSPPLAEI